MFNGRRQSKDRELRRHIMELLGEERLIMDGYSAGQFEDEYRDRITVTEDILNTAGENDVCFIEDKRPEKFERRADKIVLYRWNRKYPADMYFDIELTGRGWRLYESADFAGSSHEKITREVYVR